MEDQIFQFAFSFLRQEPRAAARLLEEVELEAVARFLVNIPHPLAVSVLKEMLPATCAELFIQADVASVALWMGEFNNSHLCAILRSMDKARQGTLLEQLGLKRRAACQLLLTYDDDMVGAWAETDVPVLFQDMTQEHALKRLKKRPYLESSLVVVCNEHRHPIGTLSVPELLRIGSTQTLDSVSVLTQGTITGRITLLTAVNHPIWQQQDCALVVNRQREFTGIIWYSQIRRLLSLQQDWEKASRSTQPGVAKELLQAHGDTAREVIDLIRTALF